MRPIRKIVQVVWLAVVATVALAGCGRQAQVMPTLPATATSVEPSPTPSVEAATPTPSAQVAIAISPTSGPPGSPVQVTTAGFPPEAQVELVIRLQDAEEGVSTTVRTDSEGKLAATLAVPARAEPQEAWVVTARTEDGEIQAISDIFTITVPEYEPDVTISPTSGPPGSTVSVEARGFPPNAEVEIGVGRVDSEYDIVATARTDADGRLDTEIAMPSFVEPEDRWVVVVVTEDRSVEAISNVFDATGGEEEAAVTVSPTSGPPGTAVTVEAQGFPPDAGVEIGVGRVNSEYDIVATARTDADGRLETEITMPSFVDPGDRWVVVVVTQDRSLRAVSDAFDVTQEPSSGDNLFTRTNIYMIAVGDGGQSGEEIGCDDSVVPVEVVIEPTIAPLRAALNRLLAIETRVFGESGLYNALYRSDLMLEDVVIRNREAIIRLSGTLTMGGVCDEPRVRAQLRQTALQYATVDRVSIFVNGTPLDDLLTSVTPTPSGNLFTRTDIYLIAIGDDGQSGMEIGCDDSVVPVEVAIEPTVAPLTAALNRLLSIETETYGQSGLYNALYQSDLTLQEVTIADREAMIRLAGTLKLGGICDEPRVRAQLSQTALQYATVDQVSIFINGIPLDEILGQGG